MTVDFTFLGQQVAKIQDELRTVRAEQRVFFRRFDEIETRLELLAEDQRNLAARVDALDAKVDALDTKVTLLRDSIDAGFNSLVQSIAALRSEMRG